MHIGSAASEWGFLGEVLPGVLTGDHLATLSLVAAMGRGIVAVASNVSWNQWTGYQETEEIYVDGFSWTPPW